jgi:hypothetical protein
MNPTIHLCLVSAQATPNITPLIDPQLQPREVIFLVSEDMQERADWLSRVLQPRGIHIQRELLDNPWDIERIRAQIDHLVTHHPESERMVLNATGGTKPMSIAAYEIFRDYGLPIFYVHPEKDRVIWLQPKGREPVDLADKLRLEDFLNAHGAQVQGDIHRRACRDQERELTEWLVQKLSHFKKCLPTFNWLVGQAGNSLRSPQLSELNYRDSTLETLISEFEMAGVLRYQDDRLHFASEEDLFFANGGWLEHYVYNIATGLRKQIPVQDMGWNINVQRQQRGKAIPNELDLAALIENRLYIIECKARTWKNQRGDQASGADALYRLDTLTDLLGGLQAQAMLVSYQDLPKHDRQRAADLHIRVCAGHDIQRLEEHLRSWFSPKG